jgi:hypothetical protein
MLSAAMLLMEMEELLRFQWRWGEVGGDGKVSRLLTSVGVHLTMMITEG